MKPIPLILLIVGGVCVYAGIKKDNPISVLKGVLTGGYVAKGATASTTVDPGTAQRSTAYVPGGFKN
jgi:uncharacterized membrane protein